MKVPVIDIGLCTECMGCVELYPSIFRMNEAGGYVEVIPLEEYPVEEVDEAIKLCPEDCIAWENN